MVEIKNNDFGLSSNSFHLPKTKRLYQVWKGRNNFLCGGRFIFGPDAASVLLSTFLIGTPAITFCIKMLLKIPELDPLYGYSVLFVGAFLTISDLTFLLITSSSDPGIVPRNPRPFDSNDSLHNRSASIDWVNSTSLDLRVPRTKDVVVNGHIVKVKYCETCFLYRPPRASHCSICNNCVQRFDHHCPWIGQCIGVTTYENFRYRYDKKENPCNKGPIRNFKEILLSKTPPSLVNFREWVTEEEDSNIGSMRFGGHDLIGSKIKVDSEMGGVVFKDGKLQIPNILPSVDYNGIDDNIKKEKRGSITFDPLVFLTIDEGNNNTQAHRSPGEVTTTISKVSSLEKQTLNEISQ